MFIGKEQTLASWQKNKPGGVALTFAATPGGGLGTRIVKCKTPLEIKTCK
jgi:hypothetical protein